MPVCVKGSSELQSPELAKFIVRCGKTSPECMHAHSSVDDHRYRSHELHGSRPTSLIQLSVDHSKKQASTMPLKQL